MGSKCTFFTGGTCSRSGKAPGRGRGGVTSVRQRGRGRGGREGGSGEGNKTNRKKPVSKFKGM